MNKRNRARFFGAAVAFLFITGYAAAQCPEYDIVNLKKIALVFGERDYKYTEASTNSINNALDISDSLKKAGFDVLTYQNPDLKTMNTAITDCYTKLNRYDVVFIYYSGYSAEVRGENFLFPTDVNPQGPSDLYYTAVSANKLLARLDSSDVKYSVVILDACKNNPFKRNWAKDAARDGLAAMTSKRTFIGYAAAPGTVAPGSDKRNDVYTEGILNSIALPNLTVDQIFTKVDAYVRSATSGKQVPFKNSAFGTDFCLSVTREAKSNVTSNEIAFVQPGSGILITPNQENLINIDSLAGGLVIKELNSAKSTVLHGLGKPYQVATRRGENLVIIDSLNQSLTIVDWKKKLIKNKLAFKYPPLSIAISNDERKAYVSHSYAGGGSIDVVDLGSCRITKTISTIIQPFGMVISPDGRLLYIASQSETGKSFFTVVDVNTDKIVKSIEGIAFGQAIGITPNNEKLYLSNNQNNKNQIVIIDTDSLKLMKTLDFNATSFGFTADSKYSFALGPSEVAIIRTGDDEIMARLPFGTAPKGIAISSDGNVYIWLPQENRVFTFDLNQQLHNKIGVDQEAKLEKFKDALKNSLSIYQLSNIKQILDKVNNSLIISVRALINELGANYSDIQTSYNVDLKKSTLTNKYGIYSVLENNKRLWPLVVVKINTNSLSVSMKGGNDKKEELFKMPMTNMDWKELDQFFRNYFLLRLDELK